VFAYAATDWLTLGGGLDMITGKLAQRTAVNNLADSLADGQIRLTETSTGVGGNAGLLFIPSTWLRIGLAYRSPVQLTFGNAVVAQNVGGRLSDSLFAAIVSGTDIDLKITIPQQLLTGIYCEINPHVALMADLSWQDWSNFGDLNIQLPSDTIRTVALPQKLKDTWHAAVGVQVRPIQPLQLMAGFGYDSSPVSNADRTPGFPLDHQFRYGTGVQYSLLRWMQLGVCYEYIDFGPAKINQNRGPLAGTLIGEYDVNHMNAITMYAYVQL
jgi:long-chain fatty acid transport protein